MRISKSKIAGAYCLLEHPRQASRAVLSNFIVVRPPAGVLHQCHSRRPTLECFGNKRGTRTSGQKALVRTLVDSPPI